MSRLKIKGDNGWFAAAAGGGYTMVTDRLSAREFRRIENRTWGLRLGFKLPAGQKQRVTVPQPRRGPSRR